MPSRESALGHKSARVDTLQDGGRSEMPQTKDLCFLEFGEIQPHSTYPRCPPPSQVGWIDALETRVGKAGICNRVRRCSRCRNCPGGKPCAWCDVMRISAARIWRRMRSVMAEHLGTFWAQSANDNQKPRK